jgi:hypothetical protein
MRLIYYSMKGGLYSTDEVQFPFFPEKKHNEIPPLLIRAMLSKPTQHYSRTSEPQQKRDGSLRVDVCTPFSMLLIISVWIPNKFL